MDDYCTITCPKCGKTSQFPFPYNIDLFRNNIVVECFNCKTEVIIKFKVPGDMAFQGIYKRIEEE